MPVFRFSKATELARDMKAFSNLKGAIKPEPRKAPSRANSTAPDFVIIGAQKCGTTFLYDLLMQHPRVEPAERKEVHFFDLHYGKGVDWYRSRFPPREQGTLTGEATPYYLFHPHAARRMAKVVPGVRLITLLRNPIDRAYSHYHMELGRGRETLKTFEEAVDAEEGRLRGERTRMLEDEHYASFDYQHFSYLSRGIYVDQLMEWSRFFGGEQMLVSRSEDFFEGNVDALEPVLEFLGLADWKPEVMEPSFEGSYPPMDPATRRRLHDYFEPHNRRLHEYLGVDFGW